MPSYPLTVLRHGELHKKALSFPCAIAHLQVSPDDLESCKKRVFYLMDRGPNLAWVLLFFRDTPHEPTLQLSLDELTGDQIHSLKGMFELKPSVTVMRSHEGIISVMTHERTLLLYSPNDGDAWFDALSRAVTQARTSRSLPPHPGPMAAAAAASLSNSPVRRASNVSAATAGSAQRRQTMLSDVADPFDDLQSVIADARLRDKFAAFCRFSFAGECIDFYNACEDYENARSDAERTNLAKDIVSKFIRENAPDQVNISAEQRRLLISAVDNASDEAFVTLTMLQAKREIFDLMRRNFFARFVAKEKDDESRIRLRERWFFLCAAPSFFKCFSLGQMRPVI